MLEKFLYFDKVIFYFINQNLQNSLFDKIMPFITDFSNFKIPVLILIFLLLISGSKKERMAVLLTIIAVILSDFISSSILKEIFMRERPCNVLENVRLLVGCSSSYSFPSSHAANITSFSLIFSCRYRKIAPFLIFLAISVCFSRIYTGVHYPSDVLAGIFVGCFSSFLVIFAEKKLKEYKEENRIYYGYFLALLFLFTIFRIFYILKGNLDLSGDEAHYWVWSKYPDISYYSKPPLVAYIIYIFTHLFGDSEFSVRIPAVIFSILISFLIFNLTRKIFKDEKIAFFSFFIMQITPLFSAGSILMTIDPPFVFFWSLTIYFVYLVFEKENPFYWYLAGISLGFSLLSKYTAIFLPFSIFLYLLISKKYRFYLSRKEPYLAFLISLLIFSPVIFWNIKEGFVSFKHTAYLTKSESFLKIKYFPEFLGSQLGVISPFIFLGIVYSLIKGLTSGIKENKEESLFLSICSLPTFLFFLFLSFHSKIQGNWPAPVYFTGIILTVETWSKIYKNSKFFLKFLIYFSIIFSIFLTAVMHYPSILEKVKIKISPENDPTNRIKGFEELGKKVEEIYKEMSKKRKVFIMSNNYQISSLIAFYTKKPYNVYCVNTGRRMNQYDLWPDFYNFIGRDAIYVKEKDVEIDKEVKKSFDRCKKELLRIKRNKKIIKSFSIFRCYNFKGMKKKKIESY